MDHGNPDTLILEGDPDARHPRLFIARLEPPPGVGLENLPKPTSKEIMMVLLEKIFSNALLYGLIRRILKT